jgi:hypothetical protein
VKRAALIELFVQLGKVLDVVGNEKEWPGFACGLTEEEYLALDDLVLRQMSYNGWFTKENVRKVFRAWAEQLTEDNLIAWIATNNVRKEETLGKRVALIMAGNIPLVGFHDFLAVVLSGHVAICKLSSEDFTLLPRLCEYLVNWNPEFEQHFELSRARVNKIDAVIATGSNNSQAFFNEYFGKYPHIFRKNRTSVAVLDNTENEDELHALGYDIFDYFGLGCRNVSHLLLPKEYKLPTFFEGIFKHSDVVYHKKYGNNYDYNKAIFLMNKDQLLDNNFVLLKQTKDLFSQLGMVHYNFYENEADRDAYLEKHEKEIQVVVGHGFTPFGEAQSPDLNEYADGINTLNWLARL